MIRDTVSSTELDVLLYIAETPRTVDDLARFMIIERDSVLVRLCRMKKKDLVTNALPGSHNNLVYGIAKKGERLLVELAKKLDRLKVAY